jgi:hypothetical protein
VIHVGEFSEVSSKFWIDQPVFPTLFAKFDPRGLVSSIICFKILSESTVFGAFS